MKTLKQLREEYDDRVLDQVTHSPEELVLEGSKEQVLPSQHDMPAMLLFRRMAYRLYPGKQVVALYYSKAVDKYLSVPFGPRGNLNLSESTIYNSYEEFEMNEGAKWEAVKGGLKGAAHGALRGIAKGNAIAAEPGMAIGGVVGAVHGAYKGAKTAYTKAKENMEEDWQSVNRKDKTDGLSQAAVNAYRRENPGSKLKTAVTEKNPTGKRAARRKSFCSRMGGMKKRLTSAKTARDPDSRINKALRRWNCEESFKVKLNEKRGERLDEFLPAVVAEPVIAAAGGALARTAIGSGIKSLVKGGIKRALKAGAGEAVKKAVSSVTSGSDDKKAEAPREKFSGISSSPKAEVRRTAGPKKYSSWSTRHEPKSTQQSRVDAAIMKDVSASSKPQKVQENKISDLRTMISEGDESMNLSINGREVTLNNSMAKRILEVYDSVNTKNKRIVESMLNEDLESFKKLLNFSIKA